MMASSSEKDKPKDGKKTRKKSKTDTSTGKSKEKGNDLGESRDEDVQQVTAGFGGVDANLKLKDKAPSRVFQVGLLYERYRKQGVSRTDFVNLLEDLGDEGAQLLRTNKLHSSIDFDAGRLFERYSTESKTVVTEKGFQKMIFDLKGEENKYIVCTDFHAGRVFERFAKADPDRGLGRVEFQELMRSTKLGASMRQSVASMSNGLDEEYSASIGREKIAMMHGDKRDSISNHGHGEPLEKNIFNNELDNDNAFGRNAEKETQSNKWMSNMKKMERIEQQLDAYERELASERELKETLPEAFSASKESLLLEHINTLNIQRELVGKELSKMHTHPYSGYHTMSELQYYASMYNQPPLPYAYPAYFPLPSQPQPHVYPPNISIPEAYAFSAGPPISESLHDQYPYYY